MKGRCLLLAAATIGVPLASHAHFENAVLSTRTASMGGAFVAIADDPSATRENPAGLSGLPGISVLATFHAHGVDGLADGYLAAAVPLGLVSAGVSWFHRGLSGALSEDLLTIAIARDLKRTSEDASLSIGAGVDLARVSARGDINESATAVGVSAGVLLRPFAFIGLGYSIRNANEPDLDVVAGGAATSLRRTHAIGLAYYWQDRLVVTLETSTDATAAWQHGGGIELALAGRVTLRSGLAGEQASAGVGIAWRELALDVGVTGHESLGSRYVLTLRYTRAQEATPFGGAR